MHFFSEQKPIYDTVLYIPLYTLQRTKIKKNLDVSTLFPIQNTPPKIGHYIKYRNKTVKKGKIGVYINKEIGVEKHETHIA